MNAEDGERLEHIRHALELIEQYLPETLEAFLDDEMAQDAIARRLEIVGEAANHVSNEFRAAHPDVPWLDIVGLRHVIVHDYFQIDMHRIWTTVTEDVPRLHAFVSDLLR